MLLRDWMRLEGINDDALALQVGVSVHGVRKLRSRSRGPSIEVAAKIDILSQGKVRAPDLVPVARVEAIP